MTAGMSCRTLFLIDKDDWWSKLAEVLVGFIESTILDPPTDRIFQSAMSALIVDIYVISVSAVLLPLHGCWESTTHLDYIYHSVNSAFLYVFYHISLCWLAYWFSHKKELSGWQQPQLKSSWHLSGSPWHTKHSRFLVMEYAPVFFTWKLQLVYCMYFIAMEPCYLYRESSTRYYWSSWWPIYLVSWVSLDYTTSGLNSFLSKSSHSWKSPLSF